MIFFASSQRICSFPLFTVQVFVHLPPNSERYRFLHPLNIMPKSPKGGFQVMFFRSSLCLAKAISHEWRKGQSVRCLTLSSARTHTVCPHEQHPFYFSQLFSADWAISHGFHPPLPQDSSWPLQEAIFFTFRGARSIPLRCHLRLEFFSLFQTLFTCPTRYRTG